MREFLIKYKIYLAILFALIVFEIIIGNLYLKLSKKSSSENLLPVLKGESIISTEKPQTDEPFSILFLGMGGEGHPGGTLADSIILANVEPLTYTLKIISIPRDLWVPIKTDYENVTYNKINEAYAIGVDDSVKYPNKKPEYKGKLGGGNLAKDTVEEITGIKVDYFMAIDFNGFKKAVDALDGIDVEVKNPFDDYFYPVKGLENETCGFSAQKIAEFHQKYSGFQLEKQFVCRYEHLHFEKGVQHMNGETVLKYVRSRHSDQYGGDFARSERQHQVLIALKNQILSKNVLAEGNPVLRKLFSIVSTDINTNLISQILQPLGNITEYKIKHIHLNEDNVLTSSKNSKGQYILVPKKGIGNFEEIKDLLLQN